MSLKAPSPYSATLGVRTSPCELGERWGNTNTQYHSVLSDSLWPHGLYSPWNSPGQNTGVGSFSLQGIFPTQGSNPGLLHCGWILYQLSHKGSPICALIFLFFFYFFCPKSPLHQHLKELTIISLRTAYKTLTPRLFLGGWNSCLLLLGKRTYYRNIIYTRKD